jgi:hypothetical protein
VRVEPLEKRYVPFVVVNNGEEPTSIPAWRLAPATSTRPPLDEQELFDRINDYMRETIQQGKIPTLNDLAGISGFSSFFAFVNAARRGNSSRRHGMGRAIAAIGAFLEEEAQKGNKGCLALLQVLPNLDSEDHSAAHKTFAPNQSPTLVVNLSSPELAGSELTPQEAYQKLIQCPTYEEMRPVLEASQGESGDFEVVELPE